MSSGSETRSLGDEKGADTSLTLSASGRAEMVAHCLRSFPEEGCGLLIGIGVTGDVVRVFPTRNVASSARFYIVDPGGYLRADREAEAKECEIIGVFHSHTHTDAYPSPTDVAEARDPSWHYVIVSLRSEVPSVRSYRIVEGEVTEEPVFEPGG